MSTGSYSFEIRVAETLEQHWQPWFLDLELISPPGDAGSGTLLRGKLPDQAALYGVLSRIRSLNLTLVSVRRLDGA